MRNLIYKREYCKLILFKCILATLDGNSAESRESEMETFHTRTEDVSCVACCLENFLISSRKKFRSQDTLQFLVRHENEASIQETKISYAEILILFQIHFAL